MADFQALRAFLQERQAQFAQAVEDPTRFENEFANLQRSWQSVDNQEVLQEITERAMRKYPPVWQSLMSAGLVREALQRETGSMPPVDPLPFHVSTMSTVEDPLQQPQSEREIIPQTAPISPSPSASDQPPLTEDKGGGEHSMKEQHITEHTQDRLAIWDKKIVIGKEIVTGMMGVAIIIVTLLVAIITIFSASNAETHAAAKDVLLFLNGLVGVVLGYYFGRVPGEVRAEKAEGEAKEARSDLDRTVSEVRGILEESTTAAERSGGNGEVSLTAAQVEHLRQILRDH
jgi:hypothetical protein